MTGRCPRLRWPRSKDQAKRYGLPHLYYIHYIRKNPYCQVFFYIYRHLQFISCRKEHLMPEIQNELHLSGSQPDIERLISSIMTPNYQMIDFARILPVPDELASLPAGMSRVKIDCYLTAVNPNTADYCLEKLPADEYDRLFRLVKEYYSNNDGYNHCITGNYLYPTVSYFADGKRMADCLQKYGAPNWSDWCNQNWGQLTNSHICETEPNKWRFLTTAYPSVNVVGKLAELNPAIRIYHCWASLDGRNAGSCLYENGILASEQNFTPFSGEAMSMEKTLFSESRTDYCEQQEP